MIRSTKLTPPGAVWEKYLRSTMSRACLRAARASRRFALSARRPCALRCLLRRHSVACLTVLLLTCDGCAYLSWQVAEAAAGATASAPTAARAESAYRRACPLLGVISIRPCRQGRGAA